MARRLPLDKRHFWFIAKVGSLLLIKIAKGVRSVSSSKASTVDAIFFAILNESIKWESIY